MRVGTASTLHVFCPRGGPRSGSSANVYVSWLQLPGNHIEIDQVAQHFHGDLGVVSTP
jgi:hypothetical protein